jgi:hypothetical protein
MNDMRLIYSGRIIGVASDYNKSLKDIGIMNNSNIFMVGILKGGGNQVVNCPCRE